MYLQPPNPNQTSRTLLSPSHFTSLTREASPLGNVPQKSDSSPNNPPLGQSTIATPHKANFPYISYQHILFTGRHPQNRHKKNTPPWVGILQTGNSQALLNILTSGINLHKLRYKEQSPLTYALSHCKPESKAIEMASILLEHGADPNSIGEMGISALESALMLENPMPVLNKMLQKGLNLHQEDQNGLNALELACEKGKLPVVKRLLSLRLDPGFHRTRLNEIDGRSPFHRAVLSGNVALVDYLVKEQDFDPKQPNLAGENALVESVSSGHLGMTKKLLSYGLSAKEAIDRTGVSSLSEALANDNLDIADLLLSHGAELQKKVQSETNEGILPLMIYVVQRAQNAKTIEYLLQKGVSPLESDEWDFTALHHAIRFSKYDMVKVLAAENTLFSTTDRYNRTPMMYAAEEGEFKAFKILHKAGGDLDHFNSDGRTAMHFAVKAANKNVFKYLISHGVDPFVVDDHGVSPFHLAALHQNTEALEILLTLHEPKPLETLLNQEDHSGTTPLAYAVRGKTAETLKFLHEKGASLACVDKQGTNLLHFASLGSSIEILDYLLDHGFDINKPNPEGETPIHYASNFGSEKVLEHLIKRGANLNTKDNVGLTPLDHAILEGNLKHTQKLQTYGATGDPLYQKLLDFQFKHLEWVENPKEAEALIQVIPHLILSKPLTAIERLSQNVELFFDNYPEKRGYHPNEAELMQFLKHPDLLDRDPEKTALISRALTSITQFIETETELKDSVLKAWGDIGLLTHAHRFWRFDTVSQIGEGRQETLLESFGFKPIENRSLDSVLGKGYSYRDPDSGVLFEFRRGYLLASHPDHNTLVIRNSSTVFGRDLMKHPAYLLPIEIQEKHLQNFDPRTISDTFHVLNRTLYNSAETPEKDTQGAEHLSFLTEALLKLKDNYNRFKFDTKAFDGYGENRPFAGHLSPGFKKIVELLEKYHQAGKPIPDLGFVHPDYPIWEPFGRYKVTAENLQELQALAKNKWKSENYPHSSLMKFIRESGVEKRAELVLLEPSSTPPNNTPG